MLLGITLNAWLLLAYTVIVLGSIVGFVKYLDHLDDNDAFQYRLHKIVSRAKAQSANKSSHYLA